jgi:hypothetical protein
LPLFTPAAANFGGHTEQAKSVRHPTALLIILEVDTPSGARDMSLTFYRKLFSATHQAVKQQVVE